MRMDPSVERIVEFLNDQRIRATYNAAAEAIGVSARSAGSLLGDRQPRASWVVAKGNGQPTGYPEGEKHPALLANTEIIQTGDDLNRRMKKWTSPR